MASLTALAPVVDHDQPGTVVATLGLLDVDGDVYLDLRTGGEPLNRTTARALAERLTQLADVLAA